jgi:hypothetical protein
MLLKDNRTEFTPAPEGLHHAVAVDVVDLGLVQSQFGTKPMLKIVWQLDAENPTNGKRFMVSQRFTQSLHKKSKLRPMLEAWRGKKFTDDELKGFDPEVLVGANCQVQVVHNIGDEGTTYANVQAVVPAPRGAVKMRPENYVRIKDRVEDDEHNGNGHGVSPAPAVGEDDVPF